MNDEMKNKINELYDVYCMMLAEYGTVDPMYFIVKDGNITPIVIESGVDISFLDYSAQTLKIAEENNASALLLISEQDVVIGKVDSEDIKALTEGKIRPSEHPLKKDYLVLTYIEEGGTRHALYGKIEKDIVGTKFIRSQQWMKEARYTKAPWK
jgi:hypothetical protein